MSDPYKTMFENQCEGDTKVVMQELVTYERRADGKLYRTVTTRKFYDNDYIDTQSTSVM